MPIRYILFFIPSLFFSVTAYAQQQSVKDSLDVTRLLNKEGELMLNRKETRKIDFGTFNAPLPAKSRVLDFDTTLPKVYSDSLSKYKHLLVLYPYTPDTRYDWDPILRKKIKINKDTWRGNPFQGLLTPTNGKRAFPNEEPVHPDENNPFRPQFKLARGINGSSVGVSVGTDLMSLFTREFWDFKGKKLRKRTEEILKVYGDSITVRINEKKREE